MVGEIDALPWLKSVGGDPAGLAATAQALQTALKTRGFETSLLSTGATSPPAVFGLLMTSKAKRTVLFYAHYDGQPVTPAQWSSDPFAPVMREQALTDAARDVDCKKATPPFDPDWRLFGRAPTRGKAPTRAVLPR